MQRILKAIHRDDGATAVEYAVIASVIAALVASAAVLMGGHAIGLFLALLDLWLAH